MAVPHPAVIGRPARHCEIEIGPFQLLHWLTSIGRQPLVEYLDDALLEHPGLEHAAIKENGHRVDERFAFDLDRRVVRGSQRPGLPGQKRRQVPRDAWILRIRQRHCVSPVRRDVCGSSVTGTLGIEPVGEDAR